MNFKSKLAAAIAAALLAGCGGGGAMDDAPAAQGKRQGAIANVRAFPGLREDYTIYNYGSGTATVTQKSGAQISTSVPADATLRFDDSSVTLSTEGSPARLLRLYQAAFSRTPDVAGLSYWVDVLERGASLDAIAAGFAASAEYQALYGVNPTHETTVNKLYQNVLHREGDAPGIAYWLTALIRGTATVPQVLASFSESQENKDGTRAAIQNGIALFEPGVSYTPVARSGPSQEVLAGTLVQLDGKASTASGKINYQWTLLSKPLGSQAALSGANGAAPTLTPDVAGNYLVTLIVNDGFTSSKEVSLLVTAKVIPDVWKPLEGSVPASGNYVYLQGTGGDYIVGNRSYLYTQADSAFTMTASGNYLSARVAGDQDWSGDFKQSGSNTQLAPGYYGDLTRYPFQNSGAGGVSWTGEGRGCNTVKGWFVVDKVRYNGSALAAIDLRFEQRCEGGSSALHGQIHWDASDATGVPGPVLPVPAALWSPTASAPAGNYVYLESTPGDYIGGGQTYLYTPATGTSVSVSGNRFSVAVPYGSNTAYWDADFVGMNSLSELKPGYYGGLQRYPFHNAVKGGMNWSGSGRGCNTLTGWFVIDSITYVNGNAKTLDARFEQHCEGGASALRGKIHWVF